MSDARWRGPDSLQQHLVEVGDVKPHPDNPRDGDIGAIAESVQAHGHYRPIGVSRDDVILAGNHTWQAIVQLGWTHVAITRVPVTHQSPQARRIMLADNRTAERASYDQQVLARVLQELADEDGGLDGTGWDGDDLDKMLAALAEPDAPDAFPSVDDDLETDYRCPKCGYEWSGSPS